MRHPTVWILLSGFLLGMTTLAYSRGQSDIPSFTYIGNLILEGRVPYRDAWDPKPPSIFFAYALCILLFGKSAVALRIFDVLWQTLTAIVLAHISGRVYQKEAVKTIAGVAYLIAYFSQNPWNLAQADGLLSLPLALGFLFLLRAREEDRRLFWGLAGAGVGLAVLFKLPFGLIGIAMIVAALADGAFVEFQAFRKLGALALGFLMPIFLCGAYFYLKGGLHDLFVTQFVYGPEYVRLGHSRLTFQCAVESLSRPVYVPLYAMAVLGLGLMAVCVIRREKLSQSVKLLWAWLGVGLVVLILHGLFLEYHVLPLIAPLAVLSANPLHCLYLGCRTKRSLAHMLGLGLVVVSLVVPAEKFRQKVAFTLNVLAGQSPVDPWWRDLSIYLREHTSPNDRIFVWSNAAAIYVEADRRSATRFIGIWPFARPLRDMGYRSIFLREFAANKPKYFILDKMKSRTNERSRGCILPVDPQSFEQFAPLKRIVEAEYEPVQETAVYILFRRK